jgi:ATP-dependent Lon protease
MLSARNCKDLHEVPESTRGALEFVWLETVEQALATSLLPA